MSQISHTILEKVIPGYICYYRDTNTEMKFLRIIKNVRRMDKVEKRISKNAKSFSEGSWNSTGAVVRLPNKNKVNQLSQNINTPRHTVEGSKTL